MLQILDLLQSTIAGIPRLCKGHNASGTKASRTLCLYFVAPVLWHVSPSRSLISSICSQSLLEAIWRYPELCCIGAKSISGLKALYLQPTTSYKLLLSRCWDLWNMIAHFLLDYWKTCYEGNGVTCIAMGIQLYSRHDGCKASTCWNLVCGSHQWGQALLQH